MAIAERPSAIWPAPPGQAEGDTLAVPELRLIEGLEEEGATEPQPDQPGTSGSGQPTAAIMSEEFEPRQTSRRITAEMLRLGQDWVGRGPAQMTLAQFADGAGVAKAALQNYLLADGSLTLRGEELRAGGVHGGRFQGITAEIVTRAQTAVATGQTLNEFAQANKVSRRGLQNFVYADGSLTVDGKQLLDGAAQGDTSRPPITPKIVRQAQRAVQAGKTLEMVAVANKVFLRDLRNFVRTDGTLTLTGVQRLAGGVQGGRLRGATAETVRQAQAAIAAGQTLEQFADANKISLNSLQKCVHSDGSLSVIGSQMLAGGVRGGQVQGVTPAIVMQAQAALAGGQSLQAFALANNVSFIDLKSAILADGRLTKRGAKMLGPERRQPD